MNERAWHPYVENASKQRWAEWRAAANKEIERCVEAGMPWLDMVDHIYGPFARAFGETKLVPAGDTNA